MEKKKYSIQELSDILGVSVAAIRKKISQDENNPSEKRYKKRYQIVSETINGREVMQICLSDIELEEEKRLSTQNKIKHGPSETLQETYNENVIEDENVIDIVPEDILKPIKDKNAGNIIENLTERYNNDLKTYVERLITAESKQLLLEDKTNREGLYLQEIKDAKDVTKNVIKYFTILFFIMLLLLVASVCFIIYTLSNPKIIEKQVVVEKQIPVEVPAPKKVGRK